MVFSKFIRISKRALKIIISFKRTHANARLMPNGYLLYRSSLSEKDLVYLEEIIARKSEIMPSGPNEIRYIHRNIAEIFGLLKSAIPDIEKIVQLFASDEKSFYFAMENEILKIGNIGSGGGWHRDSFSPALKIFVPLSDCSAEYGPTEYCRETRGVISRLMNIFTGLRLENIAAKSELLEMTRGDVAVVDVSAIHRGYPPQKTGRRMLTLYTREAN